MDSDESVVLLHDITAARLSITAQRLFDDVRQLFSVSGEVSLPQLSIGTAIYLQRGQNLAALMRHADAEIYRAKASDGGLLSA